MDIEYVDILTGETLSSINFDLNYWLIRSSRKRERDGVKKVDGGYLYFSQPRKQMIQNLVQHPNNSISIIKIIFSLIIFANREGEDT